MSSHLFKMTWHYIKGAHVVAGIGDKTEAYPCICCTTHRMSGWSIAYSRLPTLDGSVADQSPPRRYISIIVTRGSCRLKQFVNSGGVAARSFEFTQALWKSWSVSETQQQFCLHTCCLGKGCMLDAFWVPKGDLRSPGFGPQCWLELRSITNGRWVADGGKKVK